jgi:Ca2+-binding EF-hand superfamily protein
LERHAQETCLATEKKTPLAPLRLERQRRPSSVAALAPLGGDAGAERGARSKGTRSRRPSIAKEQVAEDSHAVVLTNAAFLARGRDFINSNFVATDAKPTGRGLARSNSMPVMHNLTTAGQLSALASRKGQSNEQLQVLSLANALNLPKDSMTTAYELFKRHADLSPGKSLAKNGRLTRERFAGLLSEMTGRQSEQEQEELPPELVNVNFQRADADNGGELDFSEFASWFSSRSFLEDVNLNDEQRWLRSLARRYGMPFTEVERYKRSFDRFDADRSGAIEWDEFECLLRTLSKVPEHLSIPHTRVQHLWSDADADDSGDVDFEEFVVFYGKYFDTQGGEGKGFEDYYRAVRRHNAFS